VILSSGLIPSQALADDLRHGQLEAVEVVHLLAVVVAEGLLIEIAEQMERSTET